MTETWLNQLHTSTIKTLQTMGYRLMQIRRTGSRNSGRKAIILSPDNNLLTSTGKECNTNC